jgi:DNA polymerase-3 subunit epsilon/CBS domain-containing protein
VAVPDNAYPLIALDAMVIDTEATGLDPARARIVEFGAVLLNGGKISGEETLRLLVNPGEPIPAAAAAIHGITNDSVADAPAFAATWKQVQTFAEKRVWIGHTLGFDLTLLTRECARAGLPFERPSILDTRLLAQVAEPNLSGYTLESLASWLGVEAAERHAALGDAITTARIFVALLPRLRERGIRTLGEALRACSKLTEVLDGQHRAGWVEVAEAPKAEPAPGALQRVDSYPYRRRAADIMSTPPIFISSAATLKEALGIMVERRVSSLFAAASTGEKVPARDCGIVTERDVMRALANNGAAALDKNVGDVMSRPLATVPADAFLYVPIARMNRLRIRHLGVTDSAGNIGGALSARDLLRSRASEALSLGDAMATATNSAMLAAAWSKLPHVSAALAAEGMDGRAIAAIVSHELASLTSRAAALAEEALVTEGHGPAPCPFAVLLLGSGGRGESLLAMDQDNAIVFETGEPGGVEDKWFAELGARFATILHEAGVPLCKGGVMAKNPQWRGSVAQWRERIATWIERSNPADILSVDTFFDLDGVYGDHELAEDLRAFAYQSAKGCNAFAKLLVDTTAPIEPAVSLFGRLRTVDGRIDLKKSGMFRIVCATRALAISYGISVRSTRERLEAIRSLQRGGDEDLERLIDAHSLFLSLIARQQLADILGGRAPSNAIAPSLLSKLEREHLLTSLRALDTLDTLTRDLLFSS